MNKSIFILANCSINGDRGQCKNKPTIAIFGKEYDNTFEVIELCYNHYHALSDMSNNIITKLPNKTNKKAQKEVH